MKHNGGKERSSALAGRGRRTHCHNPRYSRPRVSGAGLNGERAHVQYLSQLILNEFER